MRFRSWTLGHAFEKNKISTTLYAKPTNKNSSFRATSFNCTSLKRGLCFSIYFD